jgi:hypothetical protein
MGHRFCSSNPLSLCSSVARTTSARLTRPGDLSSAIVAAIVAVRHGEGEYPRNPQDLEVPCATVGSIVEKKFESFYSARRSDIWPRSKLGKFSRCGIRIQYSIKIFFYFD